MTKTCNCQDNLSKLLDSDTPEEEIMTILNWLATTSKYSSECCRIYLLGEGASSVAYSVNNEVYKVPHIISSYDDTCTYETEDDEEYYVDLTADYVYELRVLESLANTPNIVRGIAASYWCLVTELVNGEPLATLSIEELEMISPQLILDFSSDISKCIDAGLAPIDYSAENVIYNKETNTLTLIDVGEFLPLAEMMTPQDYCITTKSPIIEHMIGMIGEHYPISSNDCPINRKMNIEQGVGILMDTNTLMTKVGMQSIQSVVNVVITEGLLTKGLILTPPEKKAIFKMLKASAIIVPNEIPKRYDYNIHYLYFQLAQVINNDLANDFNEDEIDKLFNIMKLAIIIMNGYRNIPLDSCSEKLEELIKNGESIVTLDQLRGKYLKKTDIHLGDKQFNTTYFNYLITQPKITKLMDTNIPYLTENHDYASYLTEWYRFSKKEITLIELVQQLLH